MTTTDVPTIIDAPGVYDDLPNETYHADPVPVGSLSSSEAKRLLPPSCPARFRYERDNPAEHKAVFDFGSAAHKVVLGAGDDLLVVDAPDWRTKEAKGQRDHAYEVGRIPLLAHEFDQVEAMAAAIRAHPVASKLFGDGKPEQSLFWRDDREDLWRRARLDWLPEVSPSGRLIVPDYKTCRSAEPGELRRAVYNFGYHMQAAWYLDGIEALGLADPAVFVFVFQEKEPPYVVTVAELDPAALRAGRRRNRQAMEVYRSCVGADRWPGYSDEVELISLPPWASDDDGEVVL